MFKIFSILCNQPIFSLKHPIELMLSEESELILYITTVFIFRGGRAGSYERIWKALENPF